MTSCICIGAIPAIISIVFGIIALKDVNSKKTLSVWGLVLSGISLMVFFVMIMIISMTSDDTLTETTEKATIAITTEKVTTESTTEMAYDKKANTSTEEESKENGYSWDELAKDEKTYFEVLVYLGENFRLENKRNTVSGIDKTEDVQLIERLFTEYYETGKLNAEFQKTFSSKFKGGKFDSMYIEETQYFDLYNSISHSFVISWEYEDDNTESFYIELPEYDDADVCQEYPDYINAEGYANTGSTIYSVIDDKMQEVGTIEEVGYGIMVDDVAYGFGVKICWNEDGSVEWEDGDALFSNYRVCSDTPEYYVLKTDAYRYLRKDKTDYSTMFNWVSIGETSHDGKDVYMGIGSCKVYMFTVIESDVFSDTMVVRYPSGNEEVKSYSAMKTNDTLFVIEE